MEVNAPPPNGRPNPKRSRGTSADAFERRRRILELKSWGWSFAQIANEVGVTKGLVHREYHKAISETKAESQIVAAEVVLVENTRLDRIVTAMMAQMLQTKPVTKEVACPHCGKSHKAVIAKPPNAFERAASATAVLKAMDRRAKMFGLDKPKEQNITLTHVDQVFEQLGATIFKFVPEDKREALMNEVQRVMEAGPNQQDKPE